MSIHLIFVITFEALIVNPMKHLQSRLDSLDALRGYDMMFIMGVAALIKAICALFPGGADSWIALQMRHVEWDGFHLFDTIFPLFLFIAGISFPFSYSKQLERGMSRGGIYRKIIKRALILFLLGLVYNGLFSLEFDHLRFFSVLGRIGFAWMFAALLFINFKPAVRGWIAAAILLGYWFLSTIPAPDAPMADPLSMEGCLVGYIDRTLFPGHLHKTIFDPEGLLSLLPSIVTAMLGMFTGEFVRKDGISGNRKTVWMLAAATAMLIICLVWNNWLPVNKKLWSSSYVMAAGAYSLYMFAIFYWVIDVRKWNGWILPFKVIGMNSIAVYMLPGIISFAYTSDFFLNGVISKCSEPWAEVISLAGYVTVYWLFAYFLYRKKVFLKV